MNNTAASATTGAKRYRVTGLVWAALILLFDQGSKAVALSIPEIHSGIEVLPVLNLVVVRNEGISFGMLGGVAPWWALAALGAVIAAMLSVWLWRAQSLLLATALGWIVGGALGNITDRVRQGSVTDFLDFHAAGYHWPAFNFADAAIFCGIGFLLLDYWRSNPAPKR